MFSYNVRQHGLGNLLDRCLLRTSKCFSLLQICKDYNIMPALKGSKT